MDLKIMIIRLGDGLVY